jgi:UDPglucose 6-dehydrogenase
MQIGVLGTGHVGLITCVSLAALGHRVVGIDKDQEKIARLKHGIPPFYEVDLEVLLKRFMEERRLTFSEIPAQAIADAQVVFICVETPPATSGEANLTSVESAIRDIASNAAGRTVVVQKSTVPPGTAHRMERILEREAVDSPNDFAVVSNPEFLREGSALHDALHPNRILVGADRPWALEVMSELYAPLARNGCKIIETGFGTAELAKLACNAFLALKVSYINAMSRVSELARADVMTIAEVMGADSRIGRSYLNAGIGFGGFCLPKDLMALEKLSRRLGYDFALLREIGSINNQRVELLIEKIIEASGPLDDQRIALLGLSFKPGTDDVRSSPALVIAQRLLEAGASVTAYDPRASANAKAVVHELDLAPDPYEAAARAHCVVLCTEWDEFGRLDLVRLRELMTSAVIVDGRNALDPIEWGAAGFSYFAIGRPHDM